MKKIKYHSVVQLERFKTSQISYNELTHSPELANQKFSIQIADAYRLIQPFFKTKIFE